MYASFSCPYIHIMSNPNMYKQASSNNITLDPYPFPSELGMEAYLMDNPSILKLDDRKSSSAR